MKLPSIKGQNFPSRDGVLSFLLSQFNWLLDTHMLFASKADHMTLHPHVTKKRTLGPVCNAKIGQQPPLYWRLPAGKRPPCNGHLFTRHGVSGVLCNTEEIVGSSVLQLTLSPGYKYNSHSLGHALCLLLLTTCNQLISN